MVFGFGKSVKHREIDAAALNDMIVADQAVVIDVREADEFAAGHIPHAINMPLSTFNPDQLSDPLDRSVVLCCLGGKRSGMALDKCRAAGAVVDTHLTGGFGAWKSAGLPIER
jgi:rhodanese-related sulfurtransferase